MRRAWVLLMALALILASGCSSPPAAGCPSDLGAGADLSACGWTAQGGGFER